jgi:hypothetical protein
MKLVLFFRLAALACIGAVGTGQVSACQCGASFHGKNNWEIAKLEEKGSAVIFEGTPLRFETQWRLLGTSDGEWIPATNPFAGPNEWPRMLVTFRVEKAYKGDFGPEIQVKTGLGGGDCAAVFATGVNYLVFGSRSAAGDLVVSMCSPGGWMGSSAAATELRYLRKESPVAKDLVPPRPWTSDEYAAQEGQRQREFEQSVKRYAAVTGKICGTVAADETTDKNSGILSFLSTAGYSPVEHPWPTSIRTAPFAHRNWAPGNTICFSHEVRVMASLPRFTTQE